MYVCTFSKALLLVILFLLLEFLFLAVLEFMKGSIFGVDIIFIVILFPYFFLNFFLNLAGVVHTQRNYSLVRRITHHSVSCFLCVLYPVYLNA